MKPESIRYFRGVTKPHYGPPGYTRADYSCIHTDDCDTGEHGAAIKLMRDLPWNKWVTEESGAVSAVPCTFAETYTIHGMPYDPTMDVNGVAFGPFDDETYEAPNDEQGGVDPADEVRVLWNWGNSMNYTAFTRAQWDAALGVK